MTDYKLMPKQITEEMADAFWEEYSKDRHDDLLMRCYKAMYVTAPTPQLVSVHEIIEAVANFVGSQEGGPYMPAVIKAAILGQLEYGDAFTKLLTTPPQPVEQPDVTQLVEALESIAESCDAGRHDGIPEEGPALCATESWLIAKAALATYES